MNIKRSVVLKVLALSLVMGLTALSGGRISAGVPLVPTERYVATGGSNTSDCSDPDAPCATIQYAIGQSVAGDTVNVAAGTYDEDVNITKAGLTLLGAGPNVSTIRGVIGGDGATVRVSASNATIAGFSITRLGNNVSDWNNAGLNFAGIAIQGQAITNTLVRDNLIYGNRTGIDINNSNGHTIRNNVINDNRTGLLFRNQTDNLTVEENFIANNWTVGVLFLAANTTNVPPQSALNSNFSNNSISGNWYGQIADRQAGGAIPAPGTTNLKNFVGNWYGTANPVVSTADSAEPGYAAQIPVAYGGSAVAPGGQPDILGPASANFQYTPYLKTGTDTNIETTPGRGTYGFQGALTVATKEQCMNNGWRLVVNGAGLPFRNQGDCIQFVNTER